MGPFTEQSVNDDKVDSFLPLGILLLALCLKVLPELGLCPFSLEGLVSLFTAGHDPS